MAFPTGSLCGRDMEYRGSLCGGAVRWRTEGKSDLCVEFVHDEVAEGGLEEVLLGIVFQERVIHGAGGNLQMHPVQPSSAQFSPVQPSSAQFSPV